VASTATAQNFTTFQMRIGPRTLACRMMADTRRYRNLDGSGPVPFGKVLRWMLLDRLAGRRRRAPARAPVPQVRPDVEALRKPPLDGLRLTWLGHASWLVQGAGTSVLIDPALGPRISVIPRNAGPGLRIDQLPRIDAALVTHNHYDHLDLPTLRAVGAPVVSGLGTRPSLRGLPCTELAWWDRLHVGGLQVPFVPSQHWSRRGLGDINQALWGGFVVEGGGARAYHAGDTAYFAGFREIGQRFPALDAALLPIGAYDPEWFMRPQHMNPEDAVRAFLDLGARRLLAMHWGTFKLTDEPLDEPPRRLREEWDRRGLPADALHIPAIGQSLELRAEPQPAEEPAGAPQTAS
jgi:L-ascorbate metabolism protein UlaG (beta-lactamase superfamily)